MPAVALAPTFMDESGEILPGLSHIRSLEQSAARSNV